jgi:hypothetical protein
MVVGGTLSGRDARRGVRCIGPPRIPGSFRRKRAYLLRIGSSSKSMKVYQLSLHRGTVSFFALRLNCVAAFIALQRPLPRADSR